MEKALNEVEFDKTNKNHIIILCGDAFDRGSQNVDVYNFFLNLQCCHKIDSCKRFFL